MKELVQILNELKERLNSIKASDNNDSQNDEFGFVDYFLFRIVPNSKFHAIVKLRKTFFQSRTMKLW